MNIVSVDFYEVNSSARNTRHPLKSGDKIPKGAIFVDFYSKFLEWGYVGLCTPANKSDFKVDLILYRYGQ